MEIFLAGVHRGDFGGTGGVGVDSRVMVARVVLQ